MAQMNLSVKWKQTHRQRTDCGCQGGGEVGEFEVSRSKLVHIEWIHTEAPLCSTGNYIQYFEINHNGKEYFKKRMCINMYIHIYLNHCYTAKINTLQTKYFDLKNWITIIHLKLKKRKEEEITVVWVFFFFFWVFWFTFPRAFPPRVSPLPHWIEFFIPVIFIWWPST